MGLNWAHNWCPVQFFQEAQHLRVYLVLVLLLLLRSIRLSDNTITSLFCMRAPCWEI